MKKIMIVGAANIAAILSASKILEQHQVVSVPVSKLNSFPDVVDPFKKQRVGKGEKKRNKENRWR